MSASEPSLAALAAAETRIRGSFASRATFDSAVRSGDPHALDIKKDLDRAKRQILEEVFTDGESSAVPAPGDVPSLSGSGTALPPLTGKGGSVHSILDSFGFGPFASDAVEPSAHCISALNASNSYRIAGYRDEFLTIPGHGEQRKAQCGEVDHAVQCPNHCEKPILHQYSCHNLTCTCRHCVTSAIAQKASRIVRRFQMMRRLYSQVGISMGKLKHIVFSPDREAMPTLDEYLQDRGESFRQTAVSLIRKYSKDGFYAGTVIVHPFRFDHEDGTSCDDPDCELEHYYTYSPHVHFTGYTFLEGAVKFHDETDWIYVNIKPEQRRSLFKTVLYELGHVGVFMREEKETVQGDETGRMMWTVIGNVYSNIGLFSNACGGGEKINSQQVVAMCPKCGEHLLDHCVTIKDTNDPDIKEIEVDENHIIGEHTEWEVTERWHLNIKHYQIFIRVGKQGQLLKPGRRRLPDTQIELKDTFRTDTDADLTIEE